MPRTSAGPSPCKLTPAPSNQVQCDYHSSAGQVTFSVAIYSGVGSVAFAALYLDGHAQPLNPPAVTLGNGAHKVLFVLAFSDPAATAVIREACNPAQDLALVDATSPNETLRICVP
jgi:hypothetical protein